MLQGMVVRDANQWTLLRGMFLLSGNFIHLEKKIKMLIQIYWISGELSQHRCSGNIYVRFC